jgi:hypothetical protein
MTQPEKGNSLHKPTRDPFQDLSGLPASWVNDPVNQRGGAITGFRLLSLLLSVVALAALGYLASRSAVTPSPITPIAVLPGAAAPAPTETPAINGLAEAVAQIPPPPPGGQSFRLTPAAAGWSSSLDGRGHFNDPHIHAGFLNGHSYYGAIQFDLSAVPPAAPISYAALILIGLDDQNLGSSGAWRVHMLAADIDPTLTHDKLHDAGIQTSLLPGLTAASLGRDKVNFFPFSPEQRAILGQRLLSGRVSFRLDGPEDAGENNLFTWDSGYHPGPKVEASPAELTAEEWLRLNKKPILWIITGPASATAATLTPTPENFLTVVAIPEAGSPTVVPGEWATPPTPEDSSQRE